ncbi:E3 ubiquitin/ISG15 ligase TRIM25-like isoform X2 [Bombina bombina]|uniref:E3 ubiquitin/ISG15 ligase TRIM25-like isoform X2 n=1 Tax=Bombina bombina TaxID=8345 RepID=UPI00235A83AC|nr:E3 ubiquitin/ISG15 ligase TRIM25-like isoform X2 [Bombina bombina]
MASAGLRQELTCTICLSIYTDPVSLRCGHNFCLGCIENVMCTQEGSGLYTCPMCRKRFSNRPGLQRNRKLRNIVECFNSNQGIDSRIYCTYCFNSPVPATKSCLLCEASFCDFHLREHSKSEEHVLTEPTTSWRNKKCSKHKKLLEFYCIKDAACICVTCSVAGEHRGHQKEPLNEAYEKKKKRLRDVLQKLTTKREEAKKRVQSLQEHRRGMPEKAAGVTGRITTQIRNIREKLDKLEKKVLSDITRQQEQALLTISKVIQQLEKENNQLTRKICHVEELCSMTDPFTVLQERESNRADFCGAEKVPAGEDLDEGLISVSLYTGLADIMHDVKSQLYMQVPSDILLDINTAHNNVIVSDDLKTVSYSRINQQRAETPERFTDTPQVLSTRSFSSGRHYWEVEFVEYAHWFVGVCYASMERGGDHSLIGKNNKSWSLCKIAQPQSVTFRGGDDHEM